MRGVHPSRRRDLLGSRRLNSLGLASGFQFFLETGKLRLCFPEMAQAEYFRANVERICMDFGLAKDSSACCGVNLAFARVEVCGGWQG